MCSLSRQASYCRSICLAVTALAHIACASTSSVPDRTFVADSLKARTGIDPHGLAAPSPGALPPGIIIDDGLALDEATAIALWNNPAFQLTLIDLGIARAELTEAGMLRNPVFSWLFPLGPKQLEATVQLPAELLWQRPRRVTAAKLNAQAVAERLISDGLRLIAEVRVAYVDTAAADERLTLSQENAELANGLAGIADARLRAGDISELEARTARLDAARLRAAHIGFEHQRRQSRIQLVALLGLDRNPDQLTVTQVDRLPVGECGTLQSLITDALASRPDMRAAELAIEAAAARVAWERSRVVNLMVVLDANGEGLEGFELGPGVAGDLPIFNWNQGGVTRAGAEVERASRHYLAVRARIGTDVRSALARLSEAQAAATLWEQQILPELETERMQAENAYAAGETSLLAVLDASRRLVEARTTQLDARIAFQKAAAALDYSVGRICAVR